MHLWGERETLLLALDRLPQTFCHLDAFPRNLLVDDEAQEVVALDWSYAGIGAVGAELAPMVAASVCFFDAGPEQMQRIDDVVSVGYLEGLQTAWWDGNSDVVRLGYMAAASLRYGLFSARHVRSGRGPLRSLRAGLRAPGRRDPGSVGQGCRFPSRPG
jgi:hypothetical protein